MDSDSGERWPCDELGDCVIEPEKLSREQFDLFRDFIYRHSGIRVEVSKITLVTNRIRRRLKAHGLSDFDAYYRLLTTSGRETEIASFLDAVTTNETSFFRTPQHFTWFQDEFLPECVAGHQTNGAASDSRLVGGMQHWAGTVFVGHVCAGKCSAARRT